MTPASQQSLLSDDNLNRKISVDLLFGGQEETDQTFLSSHLSWVISWREEADTEVVFLFSLERNRAPYSLKAIFIVPIVIRFLKITLHTVVDCYVNYPELIVFPSIHIVQFSLTLIQCLDT